MSCPLCANLRCRLFYKTTRHFYRCENCCLIFVPESEFLSSSAELDRYNFHQNGLENTAYLNYLQGVFQRFRSYLKAGDTLLDFGSGKETPLALLAAAAGFSCDSFDIYYHSNSAPLQRSYEVVFCLETCEHFRKPWEELSRLSALLKVNGLLAIRTEFPPDNFASWFYHRDTTHLCFFSSETFLWLTNSLGLKLLFCESPYVLLKKI